MPYLKKGRLFLFVVVMLFRNTTQAQFELRLSEKVSLGYHPNIETYFIAERLAVQHIGYMVFTHKDSAYPLQPLVTAAYAHFSKYIESPTIIRIAELIGSLRDRLHDNAQIIQYLLSRKIFPQQGESYSFMDTDIYVPDKNPGVFKMVQELTDSLQSFYILARVGDFIHQHQRYYLGALHEVSKDLDAGIISYMESFYGERFTAYQIYIMPLMPITPGEDNYRAFGPTIHTPRGRISTMVMSSNKMLPVKSSLPEYTSFGYDNPTITKFLTVHELGHSFVNPHINEVRDLVMHDTALFTPSLKELLQPYYIDDWRTCVIEHLVRMGEIRVALSRHDTTEAQRLRNMHIRELKMVLIPLLEAKIVTYESNRDKYPDFKSFLPQLLTVFHAMRPAEVDELVRGNFK